MTWELRGTASLTVPLETFIPFPDHFQTAALEFNTTDCSVEGHYSFTIGYKAGWGGGGGGD